MKTSKRKVLSLVIAMAMVIGMMPATLFAADFSDVSGHWGQAAIEKWAEYGILNGYEDGTFKPEKFITRAEVAKILDSMIGYQELGTASFNDVDAGSWYYEPVLRLAEAGVMQGSAGSARPNDNVTRQEAVLLIARAFAVGEGADSGAFPDDAAIAEWAKTAVQSMKDHGYISGDENGFRPTDSIKRAELVTILSNMFPAYYNAEGTYEGVETVARNVAIAAPGVVLKDVVIEGDLYILQGVGEGDANIENVTVKGTVYVWGGGANSVYFKGSTIATLAMGKAESRVVLQDGTTVTLTLAEAGELLAQRDVTIGELIVEEGVKATIGNDVTVEKATVTGELENLGTVRELIVEDGTVVNTGTLTNVTLTGEVSFDSSDAGKIGEITVSEDVSADSVIKLDSTVDKLVVDAAVDITGGGKIIQAEINADGVTMETKPVEVTVGTGVTEQPTYENEAPVDSGSTGGGDLPPVLSVTSIAVSKLPTKTQYYLKEALDSTGLEIEVTYNGGSKSTVTSGFTLSAFNNTTVGTKTITVTYSGKTATFNVTVIADEVLVSVTDATGVSVPQGTTYAEALALFPAKVGIVTDKASSIITEANVVWQATHATYPADGEVTTTTEYTVTGTVTLPLGVANTNNVPLNTVTIKVTILNTADTVAANAVITLIEALDSANPVPANVTAARTAYNNLTDVQKTLVTNLDTLLAAEAIIAINTAAANNDWTGITTETFETAGIEGLFYLYYLDNAQVILADRYDSAAPFTRAQIQKIVDEVILEDIIDDGLVDYVEYDNDTDFASITTVKVFLEAEIESMLEAWEIDKVTFNVTVSDFTAAVDGTETTPNGTNGSFKFKVDLARGEATDSFTSDAVVITAVAYVAPVHTATVTFAVTDGTNPITDATIAVKKGTDAVVAETDGTYKLEAGNYTYTVSKAGFVTQTDVEFTVTAQEAEAGKKTVTVTLETTPIPTQKVSVTVTAAKATGATGADAATTVKYSLESAEAAKTGTTYSAAVDVDVDATIYIYAVTVDAGDGTSGKSFEKALEYKAIAADVATGKALAIAADDYTVAKVSVTITAVDADDATGSTPVTTIKYSTSGSIQARTGTEYTGAIDVEVGSTIYFYVLTVDGGTDSTEQYFEKALTYKALPEDVVTGKALKVEAADYAVAQFSLYFSQLSQKPTAVEGDEATWTVTIYELANYTATTGKVVVNGTFGDQDTYLKLDYGKKHYFYFVGVVANATSGSGTYAARITVERLQNDIGTNSVSQGNPSANDWLPVPDFLEKALSNAVLDGQWYVEVTANEGKHVVKFYFNTPKTLEYAIIAKDADRSTAEWKTWTGVSGDPLTDDLDGSNEYDIYFRLKEVAGTSASSVEVKVATLVALQP